MSLGVNKRLAGLVQSEIRAMTLACMEVKGINLAQGVCDTGVPPMVVEAAKWAMDQGFNTYTLPNCVRRWSNEWAFLIT